MNNSTPSAEAITSSPAQSITLKSKTASKLGKHADGAISYTISCDLNRTALFITLTANSSGGYFSRESVPLDRIQAIASQLDQQSFPSKALKHAFIGKSSNNAGFLAAILRAEGLFAPASDDESKHILVGDWASWKNAQLALDGMRQATTLSSNAQQTNSPANPEKHKPTAVKRQAG